MSAHLLIAAPIPSPDAWIVAVNLPPGYMVLRSLSIGPRGRMIPGTDLVATKDIHSPPADLERLVRAYTQCDVAGRSEILKVAECLAGVA